MDKTKAKSVKQITFQNLEAKNVCKDLSLMDNIVLLTIN